MQFPNSLFALITQHRSELESKVFIASQVRISSSSVSHLIHRAFDLLERIINLENLLPSIVLYTPFHGLGGFKGLNCDFVILGGDPDSGFKSETNGGVSIFSGDSGWLFSKIEENNSLKIFLTLSAE
ncbi:MAG: hypothetical protein CVV64_16250 [Candidatus Wallbacteria bacterium HGW-Wallbacteria-1]|uniref:Uncharacterized protein n=1 Tax=Candidatus Wallbacteria bacterium HGW-Wallbacteria-1 TaxID=2013854 RepID=A0A2N1PL13_9BACT|nr:MAG: hypothetical protein CVV64_16250 [Candidatus Wallbacteria bacterium HGW-Wallbacteria-1]